LFWVIALRVLLNVWARVPHIKYAERTVKGTR